MKNGTRLQSRTAPTMAVRGCLTLPALLIIVLLTARSDLRLLALAQIQTPLEVCRNDGSLVWGDYRSITRPFAGGVALVYTAVCEQHGGQRRITGYRLVGEGLPVAGGGTVTLPEPLQALGSLDAIGVSVLADATRSYTTLSGRVLDTEVVTVEVVFRDGSVRQDTPSLGLYGMTEDRDVVPCVNRALDVAGNIREEAPVYGRGSDQQCPQNR